MRFPVAFAALFIFCGFFLAPHFVLASAVINEVLFDPAGTDTGLEKIEIYNPDAASQDMSGWELYPDGIGYFSFPSGFTLAAKSFVTIHLRASDTNDAANLYHSSATNNMGNSSGSVALFKVGGRSKDTIFDFIRYHKPGASERKTWESTAVDAGLWVSGQFVDISAHAEGNAAGLISDGIRANAASWKIYASPSIGSANAATSSESSSLAATSTPAALPLSSTGPPPTPSLGADAGPDATVLAGAIVPFRGMAFGLDGEPLPGARFLWNFGDGRVQEGKSLNHVYYFPGTYQANLSVSSGEYTGSDWRIITVIPPALAISEVQPGNSGFVELFNASDKSIDLAGINLEDDARNIFRIPAGTVVGAGGVIVFANVISGLNPSTALILRDARSSALDKAEFSTALPAGASWERDGEKFVVAAAPTPGKFNPQTGGENIVSSAISGKFSTPPNFSEEKLGGQASPNDIILRATTSLSRGSREVSLAETAVEQNMAEVGNSEAKPRTLASLIGANIFFGASIILGLAAAAGFILAKRMIH